MLKRSYGTDTADRASVQLTRMKFHDLNVDELAPIPLERFAGRNGPVFDQYVISAT